MHLYQKFINNGPDTVNIAEYVLRKYYGHEKEIFSILKLNQENAMGAKKTPEDSPEDGNNKANQGLKLVTNYDKNQLNDKNLINLIDLYFGLLKLFDSNFDHTFEFSSLVKTEDTKSNYMSQSVITNVLPEKKMTEHKKIRDDFLNLDSTIEVFRCILRFEMHTRQVTEAILKNEYLLFNRKFIDISDWDIDQMAELNKRSPNLVYGEITKMQGELTTLGLTPLCKVYFFSDMEIKMEDDELIVNS